MARNAHFCFPFGNALGSKSAAAAASKTFARYSPIVVPRRAANAKTVLYKPVGNLTTVVFLPAIVLVLSALVTACQ